MKLDHFVMFLSA